MKVYYSNRDITKDEFEKVGKLFRGKVNVNIKLVDGRTIYAECKKGKNDKRGQEYPLMREALGQLMTGCDFTEKVIPMVAVPYTEKSIE